MGGVNNFVAKRSIDQDERGKADGRKVSAGLR